MLLSTSNGVVWTQAVVPYAAIEVVVAVMEKRRIAGRWPTLEEVNLPTGVARLVLTEVDDGGLSLSLWKVDDTVIFRGDLAPDGTLKTATQAAVMAEAMRQMLQR